MSIKPPAGRVAFYGDWFFVSPLEKERYDKWYAARLKPRARKHKGHKHEVALIPTGIGVALVARCSCGEEYNFTDYSIW
jgi:hypothetical protein